MPGPLRASLIVPIQPELTAQDDNMNPEQARFNMVEQQIRTWEVLDPDVLELLHIVKREEFVPAAYRNIAFADLEIPLAGTSDSAHRMWPPKLEARVLQAMQIQPDDEVLEIGTGSGYLSALMARQAKSVVSVEIDPDLAAAARGRLSAHGIANVSVETGDGAGGWQKGRMFDVIVLTGSTAELPPAFLDQLRAGGRLFAIVGAEPAMHGRLYLRGESGFVQHRNLFETVVAPLENAIQPERFVF
jgi:protein-L-isoaspartate(D-aspartate) O-methyltransferase